MAYYVEFNLDARYNFLLCERNDADKNVMIMKSMYNNNILTTDVSNDFIFIGRIQQ